MLSNPWPGKEADVEPLLACFLAISLSVSLNLVVNKSWLGTVTGEGAGRAKSTDSGVDMLSGSLPKTLVSLAPDPDQLNELGSWEVRPLAYPVWFKPFVSQVSSTRPKASNQTVSKTSNVYSAWLELNLNVPFSLLSCLKLDMPPKPLYSHFIILLQGRQRWYLLHRRCT